MPRIDGFSFFLGFATAAFLVFLAFLFRRQLRELQENIQKRLKGLREYLTSGIERNLREDMLRYAQTAHLAGSLFPLDDILLPPRLLLMPKPFDPTAPEEEDEGVEAIIPVIPEWPELAATYKAPTISVEEVLAGDNHVLILGAPGSGKTTLMAHLTSRMAQGDETLFPKNPTPIFVHAADLPLPRLPNEDLVQPLVAAATNRVSVVTAARLGQHLRGRLKEFDCVILLDGLDELPARHVNEVAQWLVEFNKEYPRHRLIAAAGISGYGPLLALPMAPTYIAPWHNDDFRALMLKWKGAIEKLGTSKKKRGIPENPVDLHIVMGWLTTGNAGRTIFEITLKLWAALAGESRGKRPIDWLETYLLRFNIKPMGMKGVGRLALALMGRDDYLGIARPDLTAMLDPLFVGPDGKPQLDTDDFLDDLVARRLLVRRARDRLSFNHTFVMAYTAAQALTTEPDSLNPSTGNYAWLRTLYFFTNMGDITNVVAHFLGQPPDLMFSDLLACALWLRDAPPTAKWRSEVFRRLSMLFLDARQTESIRLRALAGFVAANDLSVSALFKQAMANPDPFTRRLAILGLGALGEVGAILQIAGRFEDDYLDVRWAATLALAALNNPNAIDALRKGLTTGDDSVRRACGEALARHAEQGYPLLQEAVADNDLGVRRAGVYGLAAVNQPWATDLLEKLQHTEQQWFVRSAIQDLLTHLKEPGDRAPKPFVQPESQGWLVAWAATQGIGVPPGRAAIDVLNRALREGDVTVRRAAIEALGRLAEPEGTRDLYPLLRDQDPLIREIAFRALATIALASAQRLALPVN